MERLAGFVTGDHVYEIRVPVTIYDPLRAEIWAYKHKGWEDISKAKRGRLVAKHYSQMKSLPKWDVASSSIRLSKADKVRLDRTLSKLVRLLS